MSPTDVKARKKARTKAPMAGKKVLVTGGLGFIGSNLVRSCLAQGAKVTVYDCLDPNSGGNLYNLDGIEDDVDLRLHDILNIDRLAECVRGQDVLFNCAASTSHPFSMREPWVNLDTNSRGVINLLETARRFNRDLRFVHLGTTTQLGKLHYQPADEDHPEFPTDMYSANKCASEKYALIYWSAHRVPVTVVRLPNVFGPRAAVHSSEFTFNNFFVGLALQGKEITVFGDGKQMRNVLYVDDAVEALVTAADCDATIGETFLAVADDHHSVGDVARATVHGIGKGSVRFVEWPKERKAIDIGDAILTNGKFKARTGWAPRTGLAEGMRLTRRYFEGRLPRYLAP
jgi:UDP-glucose 4-epimerase